MKVLCKKTFFEPRQRERIRYYFFKDKYYDIKKENENTYWILHDVYDYDIEVYKNKSRWGDYFFNKYFYTEQEARKEKLKRIDGITL